MKLPDAIKKVIRNLDKSLVILDTAALTLIVTISIVSVVMRYVFNRPLFWSMELSTSLAVWMTFVIAGYNYKQDTHFSVDILYSALNKKLKIITDILIALISFFCISVCLYSAVISFKRNYKMSMAAMEISVSYSLYLPVIIGYVSYILYMIMRLGLRIKILLREDV